MARFDLVVVGAGIVGLAHALAAARRGLRVAVLERDSRANAASTRNFGFITISGQDGGETHARARRSRETWLEAAGAAGIAIPQRGAMVVARRPEALRVLEEFAAGPMGAGCELLEPARARAAIGRLDPAIAGALWSPHELRVEARDALPALARWLEEAHGVVFAWKTAALAVEGSTVRHAAGTIEAGAIVVAPGAAVAAFAPDLARRARLRLCKLQMMRLAPPGFALPGVLMTDLSLARYGGFAGQPSAAALRARLERECPREIENGVHLIVAQDSDGSLVVGDSHHYAEHADPFASTAVEGLVLEELRRVLDLPAPAIVERWLGYYPVAEVAPLLREEIGPRAVLVSVTSGTGMSTAFAIGEETIDSLFRRDPAC
jgi:FAD dependent oxidoreductase TIGR03364